MPIRLARKVGAAVARAPWLDIEFYSAFMAIGWGVLSLLSPGELIDRPSWVWLGTHISPPAAEVLGIGIGAFQLAALVSLWRLPRWVAAFVASCWWLMLGASIIANDAFAPGAIMYGGAALANFVAMGRAAGGPR